MDKKKIILIVVLLLLAVILYFTFSGKKKAPQHVVKTEQVELGCISNSITATGKVEPVTEVEVGTQVSGKIDKIHVDYNEKVKKGQLLAELDRSTLSTSLESAKTDYANALNEYGYYKKVFDRNQALHEKKLISDAEFEEVEFQFMKVTNSLRKAKYEVDRAKTNLGYATITSPINGVVISVEVEEGQTVAASMTTPTLFIIAENLVDMQVVANIDEADIGQVAEGQKVEFTVDAYPNDKFSGVVRQVRLEPTTTSNVVTYEVIVDAKNPDLKLKPGLTANIAVMTLFKDSIITIPSKALKFQMDEKLLPPGMKCAALDPDEIEGATVWVVKDNNWAEQRNVKTGVTNGSRIEVLSGLNEGERVIVSTVEASEMDPSRMAGGSDQKSSPFMPKRPGGGPRK